MKKIVSAIIPMMLFILCLMLSACKSKYTSHYSAMLMVTTNTSTKASISFDTFDGTYVMKLKNTGDGKVFITYHATLEEGNIKVYYDFDDEKRTLFEIESNGSIEKETEAFTSNKTIYIIIESEGKCNAGSFSFVLGKSEK